MQTLHTGPQAPQQIPLDEFRVREAAYALWEREGRPLGQAERHWSLALGDLARPPLPEEAPAAKKKRAPAKARRAT